MYIACVKLCKLMFHVHSMVLSLSLLLSVGCCEVHERIVIVYDETGTFWFNFGVLHVHVTCSNVAQIATCRSD